MMIFFLTLAVFVGVMALLVLAQAGSRHGGRCHASLLSGCAEACEGVCRRAEKGEER
jgi:hypothetical protein